MVLFRNASFVCSIALLPLLLFTGCGGVNASSAPASTPTPAPGLSSLQSVNHIIFIMQENRSFDSYFGKINDYRASLGLGRDVDDIETDFTNPSDDGDLIRTLAPAASTTLQQPGWRAMATLTVLTQVTVLQS
jgi:hypothetical protein